MSIYLYIMSKSELENQFTEIWDASYPEIDLWSEYRFMEKRRYRFDFAHIRTKTAIEINGGRWIKSGHNSPSGLLRDYEKLNLAVLEGWQVFLLADAMINQNWIDKIAKYMKSKMRSLPKNDRIARLN
jgi:very-short-patch-repair endonuclease